ncbi:MAG: hypothetical protein LBQ66_14905 [Planctomycetaceae bacterium]|jgi:hypothetical protein|nr:hypothetical protein [Planctomycetaceae bacterium]
MFSVARLFWRRCAAVVVFLVCVFGFLGSDCQILLAQETNRPTKYTYVRRNESKPGDYKVVVVPAVEPRQAKLDAQTYHVGWDAVDSWMGQSRVMFCVLLKKRPPYIRGTPPVSRPIPKNK